MTETLKDRIRQRLAATGLSARKASLRATGSDGTIRMILTGKSADPKPGTLKKLAPVLETTVDWLMYGDASIRPGNDNGISGNSEVQLLDRDPPLLLSNAKPIAIRGTAAGSIIKQVEGFVIEPETIGYVKRPGALEHIAAAYAILVTGDSMYPMHPPGEVRIVNPLRPTAPGDSVIVQTSHWDSDPGQAYIKVLKRRTQTSYIVEQFNPPAILEIPTQFVTACHYVLTQNDILGY